MHFLWRNRHQWAEVLFWSFARYGTFLFPNGQKNKMHGFLQWFPHCILQWIPRIWAQLNIFELFWFNSNKYLLEICRQRISEFGNHCKKHGFWFSAHWEKQKIKVPTVTAKLQKSTQMTQGSFRLIVLRDLKAEIQAQPQDIRKTPSFPAITSSSPA